MRHAQACNALRANFQRDSCKAANPDLKAALRAGRWIVGASYGT